MNEPYSDLRYAGTSHYFDQIRAGVKFINQNSGENKICSMYIPSDFGIEIMEGAKAISNELGLIYVAETTHKPDEEDFVGSLSKLKAEGCEVITIALGVRQAITVIATAKKIGWSDVKFLGSAASFHAGVAKVPGGLTEGFYCASGWADLVARLGNPVVAEWVAEYKEAFGDFPPSGALLGRSTAETLVKALQAAGKDLNPQSFQKGMESLDYEDHILGNKIKYGVNDHLGADDIIISQVVDGNWKELGRQ
jgi:branched-chain amino acid transport system substrate-binding protein